MANVIPFKGILYNTDKIHNLSDVTTPPFDVISEEEQNEFYECHPQNIVRLILNKTTENDTCDYNCHTRAGECFNQWLSEGLLVQDDSAVFYLTSMEFPLEDKMVTRFGLIARVGLEPFEKGVVLPHERTFSNVKSERLELMKACHANLSQIFSLYPDRNATVFKLLKNAVSDKTPDTDFTDSKGHRHKMWRISDTDVQANISDAMKEKTLFIADGHHRYETALNYREWVAANDPDFSETHPANYIMMYLSSMEDPGMVILPAHRMLTGVQDSVLETFIQKAEDYFDIIAIPFGEEGPEKAKAEFVSMLKSYASKNTIGVFMKNIRELYLLTLKPNVMEQLFGDELPDVLRNIDVTILTHLIFMEILGFDQTNLDDEKLIAYSSIAEEAMDRVSSGKCDIVFVLNPTKIEQVQDIAESGLTMPRKSTYFYPKVITGQVINKLRIEN
ncbi:DUF1015 domain-containing protein [Desulfonema magnum]|uniref:DUF1015 n=1 Tax=Desulfonema magnum TaxID=45655 RepID=A0A975BX57_9BACT|nr:DUF1015 domain-containing protein [Desulfonema magnum]QTA92769.1 DUF1015 [Desulfonema magnum]